MHKLFEPASDSMNLLKGNDPLCFQDRNEGIQIVSLFNPHRLIPFLAEKMAILCGRVEALA